MKELRNVGINVDKLHLCSCLKARQNRKVALKAGDTLFLASQSVHLFSITLLDKFAHLSNFENLFQNRSIFCHMAKL